MANRGRFQKKIDAVHWTGVFANAFGLAAGSTGITVLAAQHLPETILRLRGEWVASLVGALAPNAGALVTVGLILVPEGEAAAPWTPFTDPDAPWFWWDTMSLMHHEQVVDVMHTGLGAARRVVDSKAMRKNRNRDIQFVVENTTQGGHSATSVDVSLMARILSGS